MTILPYIVSVHYNYLARLKKYAFVVAYVNTIVVMATGFENL